MEAAGIAIAKYPSPTTKPANQLLEKRLSSIPSRGIGYWELLDLGTIKSVCEELLSSE